jgi:tetratricopeptide (TPR) repeat protein
MKKITILIALLVLGFALHAQNQEAYMKAMMKGLQSMSAERTVENLQASASQFERIAANATDQWHPQYYAALNYLNISFQVEGISTKDQYTAKAKVFIDKAKELAPNNSEVVALEGFLYMAQLAADPDSRGQMLSGKAMQTYGEAIRLNPNNPRALALMAQMQYGMAEFFNSPTANACAMNEKSIPAFEAEEKGKSFDPTWGIELAQQMKGKCAN